MSSSKLLTDHQILFELESLSLRCQIKDKQIICLSSIGPYKNVIGKTPLKAKQIYSFSFRIFNAFNCKIGVVSESDLAEFKSNNFKNSISFFQKGFSLFSNGQPRNKNEGEKNCNKKFSRAFAYGDLISVVYDGVNGYIQFFLNKKPVGSFHDACFQNEDFYPALSIQGEKQRLDLTLLEEPFQPKVFCQKNLNQNKYFCNFVLFFLWKI